MKYWVFSASMFIILFCGFLIGLALKIDMPTFLVIILWMVSIPGASISMFAAYYSGITILEELRKK